MSSRDLPTRPTLLQLSPVGEREGKLMEGEVWRRSEPTELREVEEATAWDVADGRGDGDDGGYGGAGGDAAGEGAARGRRGKVRVKGTWSSQEDVVLSDLVEKFGPRNWSLIARSIPGRSGKSCRLRWCNQLDPSVKRNSFTGNSLSSSLRFSIRNPVFDRNGPAIISFWNFVESPVGELRNLGFFVFVL